jgi:hypothetical protein
MSAEETSKELSEKAQEIERMSETIVRAAEGRRPMPISVADTLKNIAALTALCEEALTEQLDGSPDKATLGSLAAALSAVHTGIDSLTIFQALEGAAYNTITVAND